MRMDACAKHWLCFALESLSVTCCCPCASGATYRVSRVSHDKTDYPPVRPLVHAAPVCVLTAGDELFAQARPDEGATATIFAPASKGGAAPSISYTDLCAGVQLQTAASLGELKVGICILRWKCSLMCETVL